jgi:peptidase E
MSKKQIVALGGGGFSMEETPALDDYILSLVEKKVPRICFVPTASGDSENYIARFYSRFRAAFCEPTHLELFRRDGTDLNEYARSQDVIYVGGGNTANMLAIWRLHGFDLALRKAFAEGTILAGVSAGSVCWFQAGVTDSFGAELASLEGLGFLSGSNCPHYDNEPARRPAYHRLVREGMLPGIAADDGVALHFVNDCLHRVVSSRSDARAYRVELIGDEVRETAMDVDLLSHIVRDPIRGRATRIPNSI